MIDSREYSSGMDSRHESILERKFYLETHRLHKRGAVRESPLLHLTAEHAEETNKQGEKKGAKYVSLAISAT